MDKAALRTSVLTALNELSPTVRHMEDCKIPKYVVEWDTYIQSKTVFLYISVEHEADTNQIVRHALSCGKRVAVPRCGAKGQMEAVLLSSCEALRPDRFGIPSAPKDSPIIPPEELDLVLVPAIAFDPCGNRLGRGGGYYDRYLARLSGHTVTLGICRACQLLPVITPGRFDLPVQVLATPSGIFPARSER